MTHPEEKSDAALLSYWQQSVDSALAQPVSNPRQTSLHITAGELARLVAMARTRLLWDRAERIITEEQFLTLMEDAVFLDLYLIAHGHDPHSIGLTLEQVAIAELEKLRLEMAEDDQ